MGYSCTAKAAYVRDALVAHFQSLGVEMSNGLPDGGFWETGRERNDGAITGTVFKRVRRYSPEERIAAAARMSKGGCEMKPEWIADPCRRAGSFKIAPDGRIERFPCLDKRAKAAIEAKGLAEFKRIHGRWE